MHEMATVIAIEVTFYRIYGSFTMETILATAFGRKIDIQGGEADELTKVAKTFFSQAEEGQIASRSVLIMLTSEYLPPSSLSPPFLSHMHMHTLSH